MKNKAIFILPPYGLDFGLFKVPSWDIQRIPPIGLMAIGSYLYANGHNVKIIDCRHLIAEYKTNDYIPLILQIVDEFKPDMVGINILTALFNEAEKIASRLKKEFPGLTIIAGGPHPSVEPTLTFQQNQHIDAICIGPGEEVCLDIMEGKEINDIDGLLLRGGGDKFKPRPVEMNIDKYPFPDYRLGNVDFYTAFTVNTTTGWGYKAVSVLTSRSCPYSCKFCAADWSKPFRYHSPEYVVEMVRYFSAYDINVIAFCDDTIAAIRDRLYKICEKFIGSKLFWPHSGLRWIVSMRANQVEPDLLKLMKSAGCFGVGIGVESGSDRMLKVINKKTTVEMNRRACAYVKEAGLHLAASFMIGIPGETETEMNETITFMQNLNINTKGIGNFRPLPGSPFYNEFVKSGALSKKDINWSNLGNFSVAPEHLFCGVSTDRFEIISEKATSVAYKNRWTAIHEETLLKFPKEIKNIASRIKIKISKKDSYESSTHIAYTPFSIHLIYDTLLSTLRPFVPLKLRRRIRALRGAVKKGNKKKK
ncbi:radical SAM protein [bacterium]|nr:MAG: radical SAM protein [bacterium]